MIDSKKIAVLCNYQLLPERVGGMDYFFWMFDQKCKENNIQVDWFFPKLSRHGAYSNLTIFASNGESLENYFLDFLQRNKTEYTHVITHFVELCTPFFYKIKQNSKAKIIAVDHNPRPLKGYPFKKKMEKRIKGVLFSRYIDLFVGVSNYSKDKLIKEFGSQIKNKSIVIFNGLDSSKFKRKNTCISNNRFIVASHLRIDKGIQDLIMAVKLLNDSGFIDFVIDVYGEGYYEIELKEMVNKFYLGKIFNFKGNVINLNEIYCGYDYLIHPSHGETFCYTVVESLLCNLPVITTRYQGNVLGLVIDEINGFLFEERNIIELKNIIQNILIKKSIINENSFGKIAKIFSLEEMVENHLELIIKK
jgi:glycosyltransferase involved in cell wall biosynthesis